MAPIARVGNVAVLAAVGALLGAFVGFLLRPSFPLVGQLDLDVVLSRGMELSGADALLMRHTAEESCNYLLIGAIVGGSLFALVKVGRASQVEPVQVAARHTSTPNVAAHSLGNGFCTKCGKALGSEMRFCGVCGTERK